MYMTYCIVSPHNTYTDFCNLCHFRVEYRSYFSSVTLAHALTLLVNSFMSLGTSKLFTGSLK